MQEIRVALPGRNHTYSANVGPGLLGKLDTFLNFAQYSNVFVITDRNLERDWLPKLQAVLPANFDHIVLEPGEASKTIETTQNIWKSMLAAHCDRHSLVLLLGGGVVGDVGAFAANTYMRGVGFAHLPTSLLAQVDSSIGGKTGFDFAGVKNFIGTFAQPVVVVADTECLRTLPSRELVAGFAECFKHGLIRDAGFFQSLQAKRPADFSTEELTGFIAQSIEIKVEVVGPDETERGQRKLINFGHTVGHAVEALSWETPSPLLHGEAVAIGICIEAELSREKGLISEKDVEVITAALAHAGLPTRIPQLSVDDLVTVMHEDKKTERGIIEFTLLERIGKAVYDQTLPDAMLKTTLTRGMEAGDAA